MGTPASSMQTFVMLECARSAPTLCRRADDDERGCGVTPTPERGLEVERADRTRCAGSNRLIVEGADSLALRAFACSAPRLAGLRRVRDGTDEIFTIRLRTRQVNAEMRTSFVGHHISAGNARPQP